MYSGVDYRGLTLGWRSNCLRLFYLFVLFFCILPYVLSFGFMVFCMVGWISGSFQSSQYKSLQ